MKQVRTSAFEPADASSGSCKIIISKKHNDGDESISLSIEDEDQDRGDEDLGFDDPFFTAGPTASTTAKTSQQRKEARRINREQRARDAEADATKRAELELLMLDDDLIADPSSSKKLQHFDINEVLKAEKAKAKKGRKKGRKVNTLVGAEVQEGFKMDVDDPRFSRLWDSHEFAIDPTNPRFRKTEGMRMLLEEGRRKRGRDDGREGEGKGRKKKKGEELGSGEGEDLRRLVERVKGRKKGVRDGERNEQPP